MPKGAGEVTLICSGNRLLVSPTTDAIYSLLAPVLTYDQAEFSTKPTGPAFESTEVECFMLDYANRIATMFGFFERISNTLEKAGYVVNVRQLPRANVDPKLFKPNFDNVLEFAELRYRQSELLATLASYDNGQFNAPPGFGKSKTVLFICAMFPRAKILVTADPVVVVRDMLYTELAGALPRVGIVGGGKHIMRDRIMCSTFDSLHHIDPLWPDIVLVDECFPSGTLVDGKPIELFFEGDQVLAYCESSNTLVSSRVVRVFRNPAPIQMVEVLVAGQRLVATAQHPFFTRRGWVSAKDLRTSDLLLLRLPGCFSTNKKSVIQTSEKSADLLLAGVPFSGVQTERCDKQDVRGEAKRSFDTYDHSEPFAYPGGARKDLHHPEAAGVQTECSWRQRGRHDQKRASSVGGDGSTTSDGLHRCSAEAASDALQDRSGRHVSTVSRGGRWQESRGTGGTSSGSAQGGVLTWVGVDSVTVHQRAGVGEPCGLCPDGYVYNLEVEGFHTYLANDIVVHNCHQAGAPGISSKLAQFTDAKMYGLSATTECRPDGSDLITEGLFGPVRFFMPYAEALQHGLVGQIEIHWESVFMSRNPCAFIDDIVERDRMGIWRNTVRNKKIAKDAMAVGDDEAVLVTCRTTEHLANILAVCPKATLLYAEDTSTVSAMSIYSNIIPEQPLMTSERRERLVNELQNGKPGIYVSTPILNTGFNATKLRFLIRADGSSGETLSTQIPGRVSRRNDHKSGGFVRDYMDDFDSTLHGRFKRRRTTYTKHGWPQIYPGDKTSILHTLKPGCWQRAVQK